MNITNIYTHTEFQDWNDNNKENIPKKNEKNNDNTFFAPAKAGMYIDNNNGNTTKISIMTIQERLT